MPSRFAWLRARALIGRQQRFRAAGSQGRQIGPQFRGVAGEFSALGPASRETTCPFPLHQLQRALGCRGSPRSPASLPRPERSAARFESADPEGNSIGTYSQGCRGRCGAPTAQPAAANALPREWITAGVPLLPRGEHHQQWVGWQTVSATASTTMASPGAGGARRARWSGAGEVLPCANVGRQVGGAELRHRDWYRTRPP